MPKNILGLSSDRMTVLDKMYNFLTQSREVSPEVASAILGNVMQESTFDHSAVSSAGAKGVYQLLGSKYKNYLKYLTNKGWEDGPLSQTSFVINEIFHGKDDYYDTYDTLKERQKNGWKERTSDGTGWYKVPQDSVYFTQVYLPREQAGTMPPRREDAVKLFKTSKDIPAVVKMFMDYWERPGAGEANLSKRVSYAQEIYNHFNKKHGGVLNYLDYIK